MDSKEPILKVRNLLTRLKIGNDILTVVDNLSFDLFHGKTLALVGESGSGKSMTALSLMRILPSPPALPSEGEIIYKGHNLLKISERQMRGLRGSKISIIFQDPMSALNPVYTVGSQIVEVVEQHLNIYGEEAQARAIDMLKLVGVPQAKEKFNSYPHQLSGGLKQRAMIAMALVCEPDILIADEPTTALDVTIQTQVLNLIEEMQKKKGMALLLITHDMGVVAKLADDMIVMYSAQCIEKGSTEEIFHYRAHPYTKGLFNSHPSAQMKKGKLKSIAGQMPSIHHIPKGCRFHPRCPFVMPKCCNGPVTDFFIDDTSHMVKCWLYDNSEESKIQYSIHLNDL